MQPAEVERLAVLSSHGSPACVGGPSSMASALHRARSSWAPQGRVDVLSDLQGDWGWALAWLLPHSFISSPTVTMAAFPHPLLGNIS